MRTANPRCACVIDSMFQVPWPPEIGAHVLPTQHRVDFQHSTFLLVMYCRCLFKVCVENYKNLERSVKGNERCILSVAGLAYICIS
jgi:hypothetical protein